jgi:hypothetical protein
LPRFRVPIDALRPGRVLDVGDVGDAGDAAIVDRI